jgi:hypothetical protein
MTTYRVTGQGYGGGGPSVSPFESDDLNAIKDRIAYLLESDHAVQLYKIDDSGVKTRIEFEHYTSVSVRINDL